MNEHARKKARRAELESDLLRAWRSERVSFDFADWLEGEAAQDYGWRDDAKELIALYESNPCGCEPTGEREGL